LPCARPVPPLFIIKRKEKKKGGKEREKRGQTARRPRKLPSLAGRPARNRMASQVLAYRLEPEGKKGGERGGGGKGKKKRGVEKKGG